MNVREKLVELLKTNACPSPFICDQACFWSNTLAQRLIVKVYCTPAQQMSMETTHARRTKKTLR